MKTFVVGDLHGKVEYAEKMLQLADQNHTRIVFLGDYVDSYDRKPLDSVNTVMVILEALRSNDNVIALLGNHELSYLDPSMRCSGFNSAIAAHLTHLKTELFNHFQYYHWVDDQTLITHAGITANFDRTALGNCDAELKTIQMVLNEPEFRNAIGYSRGGSYPYGGIFWCDWRDEFVPFQHVAQIVGHTRTQTFAREGGIQQNGNSYNIDCLEDAREESNEVLLIHEDASKEFVNIHDL